MFKSGLFGVLALHVVCVLGLCNIQDGVQDGVNITEYLVSRNRHLFVICKIKYF